MRPGSLIAAALMLAVVGALDAQGQTRWTFATEYPAATMPGEGIRTFARRVEEASGGRLAIMPSFDAASGLRSAQMVEALREGRVEAADAFGGALSGVDPVFALSSLPFLVTSIDDAERLSGIARPATEAAFERLGLKLLYVTPWPPTGLWSKTPVREPRDLPGLAIRTYDAMSTAVLRRAGSTTLLLSFADAMPRLQDGTVTAVLSSGDGGAGRKLWEILPVFTAVDYAVPLSFAIVRRSAFDALDPAVVAAATTAAAATEAEQWRLVRTRLDENYARMRANGVVIDATIGADLREALRAAGRETVEEWRRGAGPAAAAALDRYLVP